jgi:hypothetical protein
MAMPALLRNALLTTLGLTLYNHSAAYAAPTFQNGPVVKLANPCATGAEGGVHVMTGYAIDPALEQPVLGQVV